ncbi:MAG: archease [Bacteroidota bacterium]|nr:archease [Bacteroidota bacterium]
MVWSYNYIDHTADIAAEITGSTPEELVLGAFALLKNILIEGDIKSFEKRKIELKASSLEEIIVDVLSELNYLALVKRWVFNEITDISIKKSKDTWEVFLDVKGEIFNSAKHILKEEVKAITYHNLNIKIEDNIYKTSIYFDV